MTQFKRHVKRVLPLLGMINFVILLKKIKQTNRILKEYVSIFDSHPYITAMLKNNICKASLFWKIINKLSTLLPKVKNMYEQFKIFSQCRKQ